MNKYKVEFSKYYDHELPNIPKSWKAITRDDALKSLRTY